MLISELQRVISPETDSVGQKFNKGEAKYKYCGYAERHFVVNTATLPNTVT